MRVFRCSIPWRPLLCLPYIGIACALLLAALAFEDTHRARPLYAQPLAPPSVRISQIYGGGGNNEATLHSDFVELFNAAPEPVHLNGWSVQYAAQAGTTWAVTPLGDVTIAGFSYLLIRQAAGEGGSDAATPLEMPDVFGESNLSATDGEVALVAGTASILGLGDPAVVDFVGYGNATEAELAPAANLANTTAAQRGSGGCTDTNHNAADFAESPPAPRNRAAPVNPCVAPAATISTEVPADVPTETSSVPLIEPQLVTETLAITNTQPISTPFPLIDTPTVTLTNGVITEVITATTTPTNIPLPAEPTPTPVVTDTLMTLVTPVSLDTLLPTEISLPTDTPVPTLIAPTPIPPTATSSVLPLAAASPRLLLTEFLADPQAVADELGEWIELYNADSVAVNLRGWSLADLDSDRHTIALDVIIEPGQYLVLARNSDASLNGGVLVSYVYESLALANSADELLLFAPDGAEADRVIWRDAKAGASTQRTTLADGALWETSQEPWLGSAGDSGTPGAAYQSQPLLPTTTPSPVATPGLPWPLAAAPSDLQIDEVLYRGSDEELIVLHNTGSTALDLTGWLIGDAETQGKGEGIYELPTGTWLAGGEQLVLARDGLAFRTRWGRAAHAEFAGTDAETADLVRRRDLASGQLALNDNGDEVLLFNPAGTVADAVAFDAGNYTTLGLTGVLDAPSGYALHRVPDARFPTVREVRQRFLYAPADPFATVPLPVPSPSMAVAVDGDFWTVWGSLGAPSIFSDNGAAPPHYLLAAAAAQGLNFLAIVDPFYVEPWPAFNSIVAVPAWQWSDGDEAHAIIYDAHPQTLVDPPSLLAHLGATGTIAQWQTKNPPSHSAITAIAADAVTAPGALAALYKAWSTAGAPLLPVGNASPPVAGVVDPAPRYTGLAVASPDLAGIQGALAARRGWLTSRPGLWLTLRAELPDNTRRWMGETLAAGNQVTLLVDYGDNGGEVAGVAIWQDDKPIQQLATPLAGGQWRVTLAAIPNTFLYAVATQADGDFAVTAPIYVLPATGAARVVINEVLPAPGDDHNGDGAIDSDDEYIELYNPSDQPLSLVGWQLSDVTGDASPSRRFTFGPGRYIGGRSWLLLRRIETRINLNNADDHVRLLTPTGAEHDRIAWGQSPRKGLSLSRLSDGGRWREREPTPGQSNGPAPNENNDEDDDNVVYEPPPVRLSPTHGQADGPIGSIAHAKLAGLEMWVEFRAVVTAPPGLFNATIYVADPVPDHTTGPIAGIGINVYLRNGEFPPLAEGDRVVVRGLLRSFRGEMELQLAAPDQIGLLSTGALLQPLPVAIGEIGESVEGRLVTFTGSVSGWQGDSILLIDPAQPNAEPVRVTVRSSLPWQRPYVLLGQRWQVTGIVSQFARTSPWNGGYRVLVRYQEDLVKLK